MGLERMRMHSREELQTWIATAEDARQELGELLGVELGVDFADLDVLEAKLLARYPNPDAGLRLDQRGVLDAASRQVGLVLILNIEGARWDIDLEDEDEAYYRLPIIALPDGSRECPLSMITASLDRRTGTFMRELGEALAEDCAAAAKPKRSATAKSTPRGSKKAAPSAPPKKKHKPKPASGGRLR
jgi:hypothetical protein